MVLVLDGVIFGLQTTGIICFATLLGLIVLFEDQWFAFNCLLFVSCGVLFCFSFLFVCWVCVWAEIGPHYLEIAYLEFAMIHLRLSPKCSD